ncbi:MAG: hypothetical protein DHS20C20_11310 [Ardenticatenaceae bacterium]|nr:MAG: hypothetical protein DHS20C20_11310 [Ardenticatenaceae bacterium]
MRLTPAWRNRLKNLTTIFLVLTVVAIIYTLVQWIRSEPGSFEPLNVLFFAVFSVASAISAWLSRPDNVQPPASSEIALAETPAFGPLRQQITDLFSLEELRVLCLDIGIRYDDLSGDTLSTKAASLLAYADRRGQLGKLMTALKQERPRATWPIPNTLQTMYDLRRNVRATWIDGVLKQSVTDEIALELNLTLEPHALTRKVAYVPGQANKPIEKEVPQLFADFGSLLILGEPGSGKTMTLLQLTESLLNDAEQDATLLTPVVLNLSSWANEQKPLVEWLVEELWQQYQLPREAGRAIIQNNQLIYLLDGLDEVADAARGACVQAINLFGEQHSSGLAVCCRAEEYEDLPHKLNLGMGVRIQPLDKAQVDDYFQRPELALEAVYKLWQTDEALQKLAQTPLFLSVITLAYRGLTQTALAQLETEADRRNHLYLHYVVMMFERRPLLQSHPYNKDQALTWMINLADGMKQHTQTIFYIERLQPSWLTTNALYRRHTWLFPVVGGIIFGLIGGLTYGLMVGLILGLIAGLIAGPSSGLIVGLIFYLFGGIIFGLMLGMSFGSIGNNINLFEDLNWIPPSTHEMLRTVKFGLIGGLIFGLSSGLISELRVGLGVGLSVGLGVGLSSGLDACIGVSLKSGSLYPNRAIYNSLKNGLRMTVYFGLIIGLIFGLIGSLIFELSVGLGGALGSILVFAPMFGFFFYGGQSFIQHYLLRWLLARNGTFPFAVTNDREFIEFLDAMKDRILLRRVGGGWVFIHRTLLDYFASLHPNAQIEVDHE